MDSHDHRGLSIKKIHFQKPDSTNLIFEGPE